MGVGPIALPGSEKLPFAILVHMNPEDWPGTYSDTYS